MAGLGMSTVSWKVGSGSSEEWWAEEKQWNATALAIHSLAGQWGRLSEL